MNSFDLKYDLENCSTGEEDAKIDMTIKDYIISKPEKNENKGYINSYASFEFCAVDFNKGMNQGEISQCKQTPRFPEIQNEFIIEVTKNYFKALGHDEIESGNSDETMIQNEPKKFQCDQCKKSFKYPSILKNHFSVVHLKEKKFKCDLCSKTFSTHNNLKCHRRIHTDEKPYKCNECDESFRQPSQLNYHLVGSHFQEQKLTCNLCSKSFSSRGNLNSHQKVHTTEKPYECNLCNRKFKSSYQLKPHTLNVHTRCHKNSITSKDLTSHERAHTECEKPHECDQCPKKFRYQSHLKSHSLNVHFKEKRFTCIWCCKTFYLRGNLQSHMRIHTLERPYSCSHCGKSFSQKSTLNHHLLIHNDEKPYECEKCLKRFRQLGNLKTHLNNCF